MSKLQELIRELCPEGVEFRKLGEICKIMNGKDYKHLNPGNYPVYGSGGIMTYIDTFVYDKPSVLLPRKGSIGNIFYVDVPFWTVDTIYWTKINTSYIIPKFLYYYIKTQNLAGKNTAIGAVPSLTQSILNKIEIPLPPLEVQKEIVRILDAFTSHAAELQARKEQYEYYRNKLLTFDENDERVKFMRMGEVGKFIRGKRFVRTDIVDVGIPCIHYGDIYTYYGLTANQTRGQLRTDLAPKMRYAQKNDVIIVAAGENKDDIGIGLAWLGEKPAAVHDACFIFQSDMCPQFVTHYLRTKSYHRQIRRYVSEAKICSISAKGLANAIIPVPSIEKQQQIASILDKFESLVNDLSEGLPAEIAAVQEQYEYYRDKLLTFKRKS